MTDADTASEILVVEDDAMSRDVLCRLLESGGHRARAVTDGPACLERLEDPPPDLVLLDLAMPGMSGLEVLAWIRRRWTPEQLPVILVSAHADSDDVVAGLEAGANDYVPKPVHPPVLLARVRTGLRLREGVRRRVEAERHGRMLEALDAAAAALERAAGDAARIEEVARRLRALGELRRRPFDDGVAGLVEATIERLEALAKGQ